jgi:hypothetical protein
MEKRYVNVLGFIVFATILLTFFTTGCGAKKNLGAGSSSEVTETTKLTNLTIAEGAAIKASEGKSLTMTIDGIQRDILPGAYKGDIVLTISENNVIKYSDKVSHYFRQALYIDKTGIVENKSVRSAIIGGEVTATGAKNITITSKGKNFNGIYIANGVSYTIEGAKFDFEGNGGNDFAGFGAALMSTGNDTRLTLNNVEIKTHGAVRTALVPGGGCKVFVRNSRFTAVSGVLDADYKPSGSPGSMMEAPWGLCITGNVRTQNIIEGTNTKVTYIDSYLASDNWGVLSVDGGKDVFQNLINSKIENTDPKGGGYGLYAISNTTNSVYGSELNVTSNALISVSGHMYIGASTHENISKINKEQGLGLTEEEISAIPVKETVINSGRYGVLFQVGSGDLHIGDGTIINCGKEIFVTKSSSANINVDGAKGVKLTSGTGVIIQQMEIDRPSTWGAKVDPFVEPYASYDLIPIDKKHDNTIVDASTDIIADFSNIELKGDFYNGVTGGSDTIKSRNMGLTFQNAKISGIISSSFAKHPVDKIYPNQWYYIGDVTNTPVPTKNNGVIVSLTDSTWTVTGTSYLTSLTIGKGAAIKAPEGSNVSMTVDGVKKPIGAGSYKGKIVLSVTK